MCFYYIYSWDILIEWTNMFPTYNNRAKVEVGGNNIPKSMLSFFSVMSSVSVKIWLSFIFGDNTCHVICVEPFTMFAFDFFLTLLNEVVTMKLEDSVLGILVDSRSDNFLVDIKGPALAFLPVLAFEGGTRRNIPKFEPMGKQESLVP
ncbi:uncharacterized protein [Cicer arietinum]|uniref:uncharacterized protein n=1 Tax=Cicer arietinum TaxID=3827 RepID=UPI003CC6BED8